MAAVGTVVDMGHPDPESVPVRDAATVMLLRDGADGIEVCMLQRNLNSDFVGGAYVFPGGGVDPADAGAALAPPLVKRYAASAAAPNRGTIGRAILAHHAQIRDQLLQLVIEKAFMQWLHPKCQKRIKMK